VSWIQPPPLADEIFSNSARYDAVNRPIQATAPHSSAPGTAIDVVQATYNEANLLERVDVWQQQAAPPAGLLDAGTATLHAVTNIAYDAKGQRTLIEYANGVNTRYQYDAETYRLTQITTLRTGDNVVLQDLSYICDAVGNITHIQDDGDLQNVVYFKNQRVAPSADYVHDALYQLTSATGREHLGQTNNQLDAPQQVTENDGFRMALPQPGDGNAMGRYTETYSYDAVGNLLQMVHSAASGGWTRRYAYNEPSLIEPGKLSNRLTATSLPGDPDAGPYSASYGSYDAHGNMGSMPQISGMDWDYKDQLATVNLGGGGVCRYSYDAAGRRVRKVWQKTATLSEERIYFNGWEIYRQRNGSTVSVERQTLHVLDGARRIALVETTTVDASGPVGALVRYQLGNHLDSALLELDGGGDVISYEEYYPFGSTSYQSGRSLAEVSLKRYRHVGKERDDETGLYYYGARYYAPWLGRWTRCDPARLKDSLSAYVYTRNRPITLIDADGRDTNPAADAAYLSEVIPPILSVMKQKGIAVDKILFIVAHAYSEQGPFVGSDNRVFNHQLTDQDLAASVGNDPQKTERLKIELRAERLNLTAKHATVGKSFDVAGEPGVHFRNILQGEGTDPNDPKLRWSPTYTFDSMEKSVEHHLSRLQTETRFSAAYAILTSPTGRIEDYFLKLRTFGHTLEPKQLKEREPLDRAGQEVKDPRLMHYDEMVLKRALPQVKAALKLWLNVTLPEMIKNEQAYITASETRLTAAQAEYASFYAEFKKSGGFELAEKLNQLAAEQVFLKTEIAATKQHIAELQKIQTDLRGFR
jgi:RHS repeat-associated protein